MNGKRIVNAGGGDPEVSVQYCWLYDGHEHANGPFDTREEAIADAASEQDPGDRDAPRTIMLCEAIPVTAKMCLPKVCWDLDTMFEQLEENASEYGPDDAIFEVIGNSKEAEIALAMAMNAWADKYVKSRWFTCGDGEDVTEDVWELVEKEEGT